MAKLRVHELAKELGVPAKDVLGWLREQGEFVKSASSTIERPVASRLRAAYQGKNGVGGAGIPAKPRPAADTRPPGPPRSAKSRGDKPPRARSRFLTASQKASIVQRFRWASAAGQGQVVIDELYTEYEEMYGVSRELLVATVSADLRRNPTQYVGKRLIRKGNEIARPRDGRSASVPPPVEVTRTRLRTNTALPAVDGPALFDVVDIVATDAGDRIDRDEVAVCVQDFIPDDAGCYGYLAWRYSAARRRAYQDQSSPAAHHDLATMAHVIYADRQLVDYAIEVHGSVLEQPALAKRVLEAEFSNLTGVDDIGRSAADELRHVRAGHHFLRLAVVLVVANPACDQRLWDMLDGIRPPKPDQLVETNTPLESAITRFNELIEAVETLLATDQASLGQFFHRAHTELVALHAGRYDVLREFEGRTPTAWPGRRLATELPFAVLPRGEQLQTFLAGLRSSGHYRGHQVDEQRVAVLAEIEKHFGVDRCEWHEGTASSEGFNNHYVVLTIKADNDSGYHAVAISPLAGEHATYVVRGDCMGENWMTVLAQSKPDAREKGAHKFLFTGTDPYRGMRTKVVDALECPPREFLERIPQRRTTSSGRQS